MYMPEESIANQDTITACVFFRETDSINQDFINQIEEETTRIKNIQSRFHAVCRSISHEYQTPRVMVSILIVPNWEEGSSYQNPDYQYFKARTFAIIQEYFIGTSIVTHDFYADLSDSELLYLDGLNTGSNCLDIMKIKCIIANSNRKHLQLDSNTIIIDPLDLYVQTFESDIQSDALNAALYGKSMIMPHSKIIYTPPAPLSVLTQHLSLAYNREILNCNKQKNTASRLYNSVFLKATISSKISFEKGSYRGAARLLDMEVIPKYRITRDILTVTNKSWGNSKVPDSVRLRLPNKTIMGVDCNYKVIESLIKKYTKSPNTINPKGMLEPLLSISNQKLEMNILRKYLSTCTLKQQKTAIKLIPISNHGDRLAMHLYGMNIRELYESYSLEDISRKYLPAEDRPKI